MLGGGKSTVGTITLTTDFGTSDHYVACMKGAILGIHADVRIVDVTHQIAPHGVIQAAFVLRQIFPWFGPGTIHVVVVDPGVGTQRRILACRYSDRIVIAPDNGIVTLVHRDAQLQELRSIENRHYFSNVLSTTFHGRDVMGPVAAHLASGARLADVGPIVDQLEILDLPRPVHSGPAELDGQVLYVDHFGNLITNISAADVNSGHGRRDRIAVHIGGEFVSTLHATYGDVAPGEAVALFGSTQMLEIAVNQASAAERYRAGVGARVSVR